MSRYKDDIDDIINAAITKRQGQFEEKHGILAAVKLLQQHAGEIQNVIPGMQSGISGLNAKIDAVHLELGQRIIALSNDMILKMDEVKQEINATFNQFAALGNFAQNFKKKWGPSSSR